MTDTLWAIAAVVIGGLLLAGVKPLAGFISRAVAHEVIESMGAALAATRKKELDEALQPLLAELLVGPENWPNGSTTLPEAMTSVYNKITLQGQQINDIQRVLEAANLEHR